MYEPSPTPDDDLLADLLLEWEAKFRQEEDVPAAVLCRERPDLIARLTEKICLLKQVEWVTECSSFDAQGKPIVPMPSSKPLADRYRLDELVGEGGFGEVWRGFDLELQRAVAVKLPRADRAQVPQEEIDGLLKEARKAARLDHPGIVPVLDVGKHDGTYFIVYKLIVGPNLAERMPLDAVTALLTIAEVADALDYAHNFGILHLDVKPANILTPRFTGAMLTDFGIACSSAERGILRSDCGTPSYMAPEMRRGTSETVDARADLYSLGVVLHELFTDSLPANMSSNISHEQSPQVAHHRQVVPRIVKAILRRCLAVQPADRYQNASDAAEEMRAAASRLLTQNEWQVCKDPIRMLAHINAMARESRKVRLFACACARSQLEERFDERSREAIEMSERYAEGLASEADLKRVAISAWGMIESGDVTTIVNVETMGHSFLPDPNGPVIDFDRWSTVISTSRKMLDGVKESERRLARMACVTDLNPWIAAIRCSEQVEPQVQCSIWRDLFGPDMFRAAPVREWLNRATEAVAIAQEMHGSGVFQRMTDLAFALERYDCDEPEILAEVLDHCRSGDPHYRGCWVIDLLCAAGLSSGTPAGD